MLLLMKETGILFALKTKNLHAGQKTVDVHACVQLKKKNVKISLPA